MAHLADDDMGMEEVSCKFPANEQLKPQTQNRGRFAVFQAEKSTLKIPWSMLAV
jgi:hypothetical protein